MQQKILIDGRFELGPPIGQGAMGEVYRGHNIHSQEVVAIKVLRQEAIAKASDAIERFKREGLALHTLYHPRIVKILDTIVEQGQHYIIMEYIPGGSLVDRLQRDSRLPIDDVLLIALGVADALTWAHSKAIIHRDIKPHNILLAEDGTPRLTDFGIAHFGDLPTITQIGQLVGTWAYLSPEACHAQPLDERADIWALGVVLYEMLAGSRPFVGSQPTMIVQAILNEQPPDLRQLRSEIPDALVQLIQQMLEKDLDRRMRSARQVGAELEVIARGGVPRPSETIRITDNSPIRKAIYSPIQEPPDISMPHPSDFDITIDHTDSGYLVYMRGAFNLGRLPPHVFKAPFDLAELPRKRRDVAEWIRQARETRLSSNAGLGQGRAFGGDLFERLFSSSMRDAFDSSRALLPSQERLRLRLRLPNSLTPLPWELLCDPRNDRFLALDYKLSLVRYPRVSTEIAPLSVPPPLQVVAVLASPRDQHYPSIKLDRELQLLQAALREPITHGQIVLDVISGPDTRSRLSARLRRPVHVLHFLCHGESDHTSDISRLIFEDAEGYADPVDAASLLISLQRLEELPRLVLLNACLGAVPSGNDSFSSVGAALFRSGVPAVIAMQFELTEDTAAELTRVFYTELIARTPVDLALTEARLALAEKYPHTLDWCIPVLFLRTNNGVLFQPVPEPPVAPAPMPPLNQNDLRLRRARSAGVMGRWPEALALYEALADAYTLPDEVAAMLERARRETTLLRIRDEAATAEAQRDWAAAIDHLRQLTQYYPNDAIIAERLRRARREQQQAVWAQQAIEAVQREEWSQVFTLLNRIDQQHPGYAHPTIDLATLRRQAQAGQAYEQTLEYAEQKKWDSVIATLSSLANEALDDQMRALLEHAYAQQFAHIRKEIDDGHSNLAIDQLETRIALQQGDHDTMELLSSLIEHPQVPLEQRLRAARLAAHVGDLREGVCHLPPKMIYIVGRSFAIGSTSEEIARAGRALEQDYQARGDKVQARVAGRWTEDEINDRSLAIRSFEIARYPVTNAQYALFIADNGYDPDQPWWTSEAQQWLRSAEMRWPLHWDDVHPDQTQCNHPVVFVTWYEVHAFCRWLSQHSEYNPQHYVYRLPTELEWEYAARGSQRRLYPWGMDKADVARANVDRHYAGTTPVGCFISGATPDGIYDLAGNVWEWTGSIYKPYPYDPRDGREQLDHVTDNDCTIRGGGWRSSPTLLRASHRYYYAPDYCDNNLGFRLARTLSLK
jgi:serine/threonine protein kinase/formylglycine-generating enzyme required for sulfatase activity